MRRIVILTALCLILTFNLEAKKVEGKIFFENDTVDVILCIPVKLFTKVPKFEKLQYKVMYYDSSGQKIKLRPDQAKAYCFTYEYQKIRMISVFNSLGLGSTHPTSNNIFLHLEIDGELRLFLYYDTVIYPDLYNLSTGAPVSIQHYNIERCILQKDDGELKKSNEGNFKKEMAAYFSNCPELVEKILKKEYDKYDIKSIVTFYNLYCAN